MVNIIQSCGDTLLVIINDILDFSKIESGQLKLENNSFQLNHLIDEVLFLFSFEATKKKVSLIKKIARNTPNQLLGDTTRIKQVISNLISNAIKFTKTNGNVLLNIQFNEISQNKIELIINIIDTGIGIKKEDQKKLFTAFTQADSSITRSFGGTGLGLIICSKIIRIMKGSINLESEYNKGTKVTLKIPLEIAPIQNIDSQNLTSIDTQTKQINKKHKILLVEDNSINQILAKAMLKKIGYSCDVAVNGLEALKAVKNKKYTIIFMDIMMPEMDGITATKEIIKTYSNNRPKIIAMTANVLTEDKDKCFEAGMDGFIAKPIQLDKLKLSLE